jgi:hypothetical protein
MTEKLEKQLVEKYPKILRDYKGDPMSTCMSWGFEHDDGWYELLDKAMGKIQYLCDKFSTPENEVQVIADQIKEKYGTLRFYVHIVGANEIESSILYSFVDRAEAESVYTCEITGRRGTLCNKRGWVRTLSKEKAQELGYNTKEEKE